MMKMPLEVNTRIRQIIRHYFDALDAYWIEEKYQLGNVELQVYRLNESFRKEMFKEVTKRYDFKTN